MKHIDAHNFDEWLFNYFEGELSGEEKKQLFQHLKKDPSNKIEFEAWESSYVKNTRMIYPGMQKLLVETSSIRWARILWGTGILVLLLASGYAVKTTFFSGTSDSDKLAEQQTAMLSTVAKGQEQMASSTIEGDVSATGQDDYNTFDDKSDLIKTNQIKQKDYSNASVSGSSLSAVSGNANTNGLNKKYSKGNDQVLNTDNIAKEGVNATSEDNEGNQNKIDNTGEIFKKQSDNGKIKEPNEKHGEDVVVNDNTSIPPSILVKRDIDDDAEMESEKSNFILPGGCVKDPSFIQHTSSPLFINPAFVGSMQCSRISTAYHNQLAGTPDGFSAFYLSYDQYVHGIRGGVGLVSYYAHSQGGGTNTVYNGLIYSPKISIRKKVIIEPAVQFGHYYEKLNWNQMDFNSQTDPTSGLEYSNDDLEDGVDNSTGFFDISSGILVSTRKFFGGIAIEHLTQPAQKFTSNERLPGRFTFQVGSTFQIRDPEFTISPSMQYIRQRNRDRLMWSSTFTYKWMLAGIGFGNRDLFVLMAGCQVKKFRIGYNYDTRFSSIGNGTPGSHEISIRYLFNCKGKKLENPTNYLSRAH